MRHSRATHYAPIRAVHHRRSDLPRTPVARPRGTPLTWGLCALLASLAVARKLTEARSGAMLYQFGALPVPLAAPSEAWRLVAYGLVHAGAVHLAVNLAALAFFGRNAERALGRARYAAVYLAAGFAGGVAASMAARGPALVVGASGSIFGLVGATLAWLLGDRAACRRPEVRAELAALAVVIAVQCVSDAVSATTSGAAHSGGLAAGVLLGVTFRWMFAVERARAKLGRAHRQVEAARPKTA